VTEKRPEHIYIEQMIAPVAEATGLSKRVVKSVITAFCREAARELSEGRELTLRGFGRFKIATIKSYWNTDLNGNRRAQKKFRRIYFSPSANLMKKLNSHLHRDKASNE